ncbi:MAG: bifunctional DNA-formamidopyrimidine glycosylase/DNA-(apurinic or apyrimidinic site) lyase [Acidobacteria bacterium]|nr:bifunctional DNA-formamidopyrimidine glycosylase/DNA-(apurinic or apyrimidinic site) lyase [Acidobacteriota bacterium]
MPEMPEVEAVCRRLRAEAEGATIRRARILRPSMAKGDIEEACRKARLTRVERRGKNILLHLSSGPVLHVHLRMTGNLYVTVDHRMLVTSARAVFELTDGRGIVFEDPRALGRIALLERDSLPEVGLDPLSPEFTAEVLALLVRGSKRPAKLFLMDQDKVSGLGNIYAAEALFRAGIDPRRAVGSLRRPRIARLYQAIVEVMRAAVETSDRLYSSPGRLIEAERQELMVYDREGEPCRVCRRPILRLAQGGRSTYFCGKCQG